MKQILNQESFIQVSKLSKVYHSGAEELRAVDHITTSFRVGEMVTILGPSGSGKSTFLNLLGGIDDASNGEIIMNGVNIVKLSQSKLTDYRRDNIGFVFQFYNLIPNLNVYENIEVVEDICSNPLSIDMLLKTLGIAEQAYKYPMELSGGQQQRVAIARAIVKNPKILLCDEPTGALDSKSSIDILKLLTDVNETFHTTIFIVTHNSAIADITDRVLHIRDGKIVSDRSNEKRASVSDIVW